MTLHSLVTVHRMELFLLILKLKCTDAYSKAALHNIVDHVEQSCVQTHLPRVA